MQCGTVPTKNESGHFRQSIKITLEDGTSDEWMSLVVWCSL